METKARKSVAPFYAVAALWLIYALLFPLYAPLHYILLAAVSAAVFFGVGALCKNAGVIGGTEEARPKAAEAGSALRRRCWRTRSASASIF